MKNFVIGLLVVSAAIAATGCGKKLDDSQTADVGNVMGGLQSPPGSSTSLRAVDVTAPADDTSMTGYANQMISGAVWLTKFRVEAGEDVTQPVNVTPESEALAPFQNRTTSCPASQTYAGMSCTATCTNSNKTISDTCKISSSIKETCNGTAYTVSNMTASYTVDLSALTTSGSSVSGKLSMSFSMSADVTGGNLAGGNLACNIAITLDLDAIKAGSTAGTGLGCDNFTCTYGGTNVDCTKLQSAMGSGKACTASSS